MKPGEKVVLLIGVLAIALLTAYYLLYSEQRQLRRWKACAPDVQQLCSPGRDGKSENARIIKCLVANQGALSKACQKMVADKYGRLSEPKRKSDDDAPPNLPTLLAACRNYWSAECNLQNDANGDNVHCFARQANFASFSRPCLEVMIEVVQWAPKACTEAAAAKACPATGVERLACFLHQKKRFPKQCTPWLGTVEIVQRQYESKP